MLRAFGAFALIVLAGCARPEERIIARAKTHCAALLKPSETLSWSVKKADSRGWTVHGIVEPRRLWGVGYEIGPDGHEVTCGTFDTHPTGLGPGHAPSPTRN